MNMAAYVKLNGEFFVKINLMSLPLTILCLIHMMMACHGKAFHISGSLTHKQLDRHACVISTVATNALVLMHQAISIHNPD